ncbi:DNA internalization-related competence protein ComEC/Rec2 [Peptoniphilus harei]|uniref:DNA internalization-related competence protein ComEC/Rec2 n=1 Tax=Peptoniphilus harei TaxID=54005 RepID=UPI0025887F9F|nr:DNA internalization-related competence protein ComEC/Rec2 [Peptoniphilus harei]MDU6743226.1 DNA internalization-related competence protein ComEC/Rec2 [Peptoniphilus harei]
MYLFAGVMAGILLSIYIKSYILVGIILLICTGYIFSLKNKYNFLYLPLVALLVFINFNARDYKLNSFDGDIVGKVVLSNENKSVIKTNFIKGKNFKTKVLVYEKLDRGGTYKIRGKFYPPLPDMNKGTFDYEKNNKAQGIYLLGKLSRVEKISDLRGIYKLSNIFIDRAKYFFNENLNERNAGLLASLILADKSLVDSFDRDRFDSLGMSHILAVSGLHIGVLALFLEFIIKKISKNKKFADLALVIILFLYIMAIGFPISAVRAFLFYILYKGNTYLEKDIDNRDIFFLSLSIILFINPMAIYSISLLLSYGAIFGLIFVYPHLIERVSSKSLINKSIIGTLSVLISVFPLVNYYFSGFSILVFVANLFIVPIYSIIISLGFIMGIGIFPSLIGSFLDILMNATYGLESLLISKGSIFLILKAVKFEYIFVYYIFLILILNRHKINEIIRPNLKLIEIYMTVSFIMMGIGIYKDLMTFEISQLYVDQGDCTLISYRGKNYLIDTGGARFENKIAEKYLFPSLKLRGVSTIDGIFISHFDEDHAGNLNKILKNYRVKNVFVNHLPKDKSILENAEKYSNIIQLSKRDRVKLFKDTSMEVLLDNKDRSDENDKSMVLLLNHKGFKTLFTGDISAEVESQVDREINLLKVAHHGSKTSTSEEFLEKTKPVFAMISAGYENSYGHPHKEVLKNLEKHGIIYYVTSKDGETDFKIFGDKLQIDIHNKEEDYKTYLLLIILKTGLLYIFARKNYELQENLQR